MEIIKADSRYFSRMEDLIHQVWKPTFLHRVDYRQLALMEDEMYSAEAFAEQSRAGHIFLAAMENGEMLGFISYLEQTDLYRIPKLYVNPSAHRKGTGSALLNQVRILATEQGKKHLELNINRYNSSLYFYRRYGFYIYRSEDIKLGEFWLNDYVLRYDL